MGRTRKRLLVVDGYNVLRSGSRYKWVSSQAPHPDYADDSFNRAREALINDVCAYAGRDCDAVVVFDGGMNAFSDGRIEYVGGVKVIFSAAGESADAVIERLSRDARERGLETMVVTSDAAVQNTVFGFGVDRMSAEGFSSALGINEQDFNLETIAARVEKRTIGARISKESYDRLVQLRSQL